MLSSNSQIMGEKKQRQRSRDAVLRDNPSCIYCGRPATTTDHCPPRCFFESRRWPEGYEFSACHECNQEAGSDEQIVAVLVRIRLSGATNASAAREWERLFQGVLNNRPDVVAEWQVGTSRNDLRRKFRSKFGAEGDQMRSAGYGMVNVGPLTRAAIDRIMVKLGKALFWQHSRRPFEGVLYARHISSLEKDFTPEFLDEILRKAPVGTSPQRNAKSLADQFIYRFNCSPEHGALHAVVRFSEQFMFQIVAVSFEMDARLRAGRQDRDLPLPSGNVRHECRLTPVG